MESTTFQNLIVWQRAHDLVLAVYRMTNEFSRSKIYGLSSQFRQAAVSIAANIAEGFRKRGKSDKLRFYNIAEGSLEECRYDLILTRDLGYADIAEASHLLQETSKLLTAYAKGLERSTPPPTY
jgi:four helix bundle protein